MRKQAGKGRNMSGKSVDSGFRKMALMKAKTYLASILIFISLNVKAPEELRLIALEGNVRLVPRYQCSGSTGTLVLLF